MNKNFKTNLLYGSLWGFAEATLGYLLHWILFPISGMIMFPIGFYFMKRAEKENDQSSSIFQVAVIAAVIKSVNLFMPNPMIYKALNPIFMILLQGCLVFVLLRKDVLVDIKRVFSAAFIWRIIFIGILLLEFKSPSNVYYLSGDASRLINFLFINPAINTVVITLMHKYAFKIKFKLSPNYGFLVFLLAISIQFVL